MNKNWNIRKFTAIVKTNHFVNGVYKENYRESVYKRCHQF